MMKLLVLPAVALLAAFPTASRAESYPCGIAAHIVNKVQSTLATVIAAPDANGGIFKPNRMWSAIVDRQGVLCSIINSANDPWPGSRAIAIGKANTANGFNNSGLALSTANLYALSIPGGELYGLNNSNPFNPAFLPQNLGVGYVTGGIITYGGGLGLYDKDGQVIGGLGVSGDTSCADHAIAYRMRRLAGYDHIPGGAGLNGTDNIVYAPFGTIPNGFEQPHCVGSDITP